MGPARLLPQRYNRVNHAKIASDIPSAQRNPMNDAMHASSGTAENKAILNADQKTTTHSSAIGWTEFLTGDIFLLSFFMLVSTNRGGDLHSKPCCWS